MIIVKTSLQWTGFFSPNPTCGNWDYQYCVTIMDHTGHKQVPWDMATLAAEQGVNQHDLLYMYNRSC